MRRRKFIAALGGAAIAWPLEARAQHSDRVRRIGVLMGYAKNDPVYQSWFATFKARLSAVNRNLQIDDRWVSANVTSIDDAANEIIALKPEVIFASTTPVVAALKRRTSTIPVVFAIVSDPLGAGFVDSLAHPGGNITGFINVESSMGGKWLYLLKEVAPTITHAAIMFNPATAPRGGDFFLPSFDEAGRKLSMRTSAATVHNSGEISSAIVDLVQSPGGGLVIMSDSFMSVHREEVMRPADMQKLPVVWGLGAAAEAGALLSYAPDSREMFSGSAGYVERILKGERPSDLPVQEPTKFELVINLKTAKELGLTVPQTLLATADEVIE